MPFVRIISYNSITFHIISIELNSSTSVSDTWGIIDMDDKNNGSKMVPCGTPDKTGCQVKDCPSITVLCHQSVKQLLKQGSNFPLTPTYLKIQDLEANEINLVPSVLSYLPSLAPLGGGGGVGMGGKERTLGTSLK